MFNLRLKDKYKYKKYILMDEETGELHGKITRSEEDIIKEIIFWPTMTTLFVAMGFDNIYIGVVFGIIHLLIVLLSVLEKVNDG